MFYKLFASYLVVEMIAVIVLGVCFIIHLVDISKTAWQKNYAPKYAKVRPAFFYLGVLVSGGALIVGILDALFVVSGLLIPWYGYLLTSVAGYFFVRLFPEGYKNSMEDPKGNLYSIRFARAVFLASMLGSVFLWSEIVSAHLLFFIVSTLVAIALGMQTYTTYKPYSNPSALIKTVIVVSYLAALVIVVVSGFSFLIGKGFHAPFVIACASICFVTSMLPKGGVDPINDFVFSLVMGSVTVWLWVCAFIVAGALL